MLFVWKRRPCEWNETGYDNESASKGELNKCIEFLRDGKLLVKFSDDAIAQEWKYRLSYLAGLYNRPMDHKNALKRQVKTGVEDTPKQSLNV